MGIKTSALVVALIASAIATLLTYSGIPVDREVIEDAIKENLPNSSDVQENVEETFTGTVVSVIDGDTIVVETTRGSETVRLIGIDSPEIQGSPRGEGCYGEEAAQAMRDRIEGEVVELRTDPTQDRYDTYNRLLAYVLADGVDVGQQLIQDGFAKEYTFRGRLYEKRANYIDAEQTAMDTNNGLWFFCD